MLDEIAKEKLRSLTVELLLEVRAAYLSTPHANALKHWDMIQDRIRLAARTTTGAEEWATSIARALQLGAPRASYSAALMALTHEVHERRAASSFLDLVDSEWGFLMALARSIAEQRKAASA